MAEVAGGQIHDVLKRWGEMRGCVADQASVRRDKLKDDSGSGEEAL